MDLPRHPEAGGPADGPEREPPVTGSRAAVVVIAVIAGLVVLILILHLAGVLGPGAH